MPDDEHEAAPRPGQDRGYTVRAVDRVCAILDLLQEAIEGVALVDIAEATELPKSSAFRYLWTLEQHRYVERDPVAATYRLGLGFIGLQSRQLEVLRQRVLPRMEALRDRFDETINFGVLDGDAVIYLEIVESHRGVRLAARRGDRDPLHSTSLGKAIAAGLPEPLVRAVLDRSGMPARTRNTITTLEDFLAELGRVRRTGYAVDDGENEIDGRCVAVPLPDSHLPAALSLSAPAGRFPLQDVAKVAEALRDAAGQIMPRARAEARTL